MEKKVTKLQDKLKKIRKPFITILKCFKICIFVHKYTNTYKYNGHIALRDASLKPFFLLFWLSMALH